MKSYIALLKREYLEHRGVFVVTPAIVTLFVIVALGLALFANQVEMPSEVRISSDNLYQAIYATAASIWIGYLNLALFFYFADSFSADRRNNALLFWKSMPQSDLKVLGTKMLAGITIFPAAIIVFMLISGVVGYGATIAAALRLPVLAAPGLGEAVVAFGQISLAGIVGALIWVLWYAPFFGWVAILSTLFGRWSIALALLVPAMLSLLERATNIANVNAPHYFSRFMEWRLQAPPTVGDFESMAQFENGFSAIDSIAVMVTRTDWPALVAGLAFAALMTWIASEYRRRRIEA